MSSINTISSAISRLCGSAAIYGGRSTGRAARKRASTSWVRSVDAFVRLARRARMAPIGRAIQFLCSPFDRSGSGKPVRASAAVTVLPRPNRVFRHRSSGRTCPPAHLDSFASVTALPHLPSPNTFIEAHSAPPKKLTPIRGSNHPNNRSPRSICRRLVGAGISVRQRLPKPPPDAPATHDDLHSALASARHARMPATNVNVPSCLKLQRFETIFQIPALSQSNYKRQRHRSDFATPFSIAGMPTKSGCLVSGRLIYYCLRSICHYPRISIDPIL